MRHKIQYKNQQNNKFSFSTTHLLKDKTISQTETTQNPNISIRTDK